MMNTMPVSEVIEKVADVCKKNGVQRLDLFGSFATGTQTPTSDIDFVVYGCKESIFIGGYRKVWKTNLLTVT